MPRRPVAPPSSSSSSSSSGVPGSSAGDDTEVGAMMGGGSSDSSSSGTHTTKPGSMVADSSGSSTPPVVVTALLRPHKPPSTLSFLLVYAVWGLLAVSGAILGLVYVWSAMLAPEVLGVCTSQPRCMRLLRADEIGTMLLGPPPPSPSLSASKSAGMQQQRSLSYRLIDLSDGQWRDFRANLPLLLALMAVSSVLCRVLCRPESVLDRTARRLFGQSVPSASLFHALLGLGVLVVQHGQQALAPLALIALAYLLAIATRAGGGGKETGVNHSTSISSSNHNNNSSITSASLGSRLRVPITWLLAVAVLLLKESYRLRNLAPQLFYESIILPWLFDRRIGGLYSWHLPANFLALRLVSFLIDDHRNSLRTSSESSTTAPISHQTSGGNDVSGGIVKREQPESSSGGQVVTEAEGEAKSGGRTAPTDSSSNSSSNREGAVNGEAPLLLLPREAYCFANLLSYCLYAPLYMAGPIMTFDDYVRDSLRQSSRGDSASSSNDNIYVITYAARWLCALLLLETGLRYFPVFALLQSDTLWQLPPRQLALLFYMTLKLMWLKFLVLWRFFRLWALAEGKQSGAVPENMLRCMTNNSSLADFWRGWHASFNQWILKYMYRPLGRARLRILRPMNVWLVFVFVAAWHDFEPKLFAWAALNAGFYQIEVYSRRFFYGPLSRALRLPPWASACISIAASSVYVFVLVGVNMLGYAMGLGGVDRLRKLLFGSSSSSGSRTSAAGSYLLGLSPEAVDMLSVSFGVVFIAVVVMRCVEELRLRWGNKEAKETPTASTREHHD